MVLFFAPSRTRPLCRGAASSISFCSATPVLLAAFVFPSRLFDVLSGLQGDSFTQLCWTRCFSRTEGWRMHTLLSAPAMAVPSRGSVSNFCLRGYATRLPAHGHEGCQENGPWNSSLPALQLARLRKSPQDPSQVFQGECDKPQQGD